MLVSRILLEYAPPLLVHKRLALKMAQCYAYPVGDFCIACKAYTCLFGIKMPILAIHVQ